MKINILTLFPEMFNSLNHSIIGKALQRSCLQINVFDIREHSKDKHKKCDDYPFGGGAGMVMTPQPIFDAFQAIDPQRQCLRIYMSPKGTPLKTNVAKDLAQAGKDLAILCGHYEGVDQRVLDLCIDTEISIGDYILTGGELPAMVLIDSVSRFVPGVLGSSDSAADESFSDGLLEYPQYTRPQIFEGIAVPDVLISGHHKQIESWRTQQAQMLTQKLRPDLIK